MLRVSGETLMYNIKQIEENCNSDWQEWIQVKSPHLLSGIGLRILERIANDPLRSRLRDELEALRHLGCLPVLDATVQVLHAHKR